MELIFGNLKPQKASLLLGNLSLQFPLAKLQFNQKSTSADAELWEFTLKEPTGRTVLQMDAELGLCEEFPTSMQIDWSTGFPTYEVYYNVVSDYPDIVSKELSSLTFEAQSSETRESRLYERLLRGCLFYGKIHVLNPFSHPAFGGRYASSFYLYLSNENIATIPYIVSEQFSDILPKTNHDEEKPIYGIHISTKGKNVTFLAEITDAKRHGENWSMLYGSSSCGPFRLKTETNILVIESFSDAYFETLTHKFPGLLDALFEMSRAVDFKDLRMEFPTKPIIYVGKFLANKTRWSTKFKVSSMDSRHKESLDIGI